MHRQHESCGRKDMNLSLLAVSGVENHRQMHVRVCGIAWYNPVQLIFVLCFHRQDTYSLQSAEAGNEAVAASSKGL